MMKKMKLIIKWSNKENDFMIYYPSRADGHFMTQFLKPWKYIHPRALIGSFIDRKTTKEVTAYQGAIGSYALLEDDWIAELVERGYDKKTLKFEISIDPQQLKNKFPHIYEELSEEEKEELDIV